MALRLAFGRVLQKRNLHATKWCSGLSLTNSGGCVLGKRSLPTLNLSRPQPWNFLYSQGPVSLRKSGVWQQRERFLSTDPVGSKKEEASLQWYDIDTLEFANIVHDYLEGKTVDTLRLIDVREPEELVEDGQIPGTINIPRENAILYLYVMAFVLSWRC